MIVGDEFDFISGVIASDVVFDDVLNNAFISFVCAGDAITPLMHQWGCNNPTDNKTVCSCNLSPTPQ